MYELAPISMLKTELGEESLRQWESEWSTTTNGELTKTYFPSVRNRLKVKLTLTHNFTAITTGHGKFGEYFYRFKLTDDPTCVCKKNRQSAEHILWECELLKSERKVFKKAVLQRGGKWPINSHELMGKHVKLFQKYVNKIDFESLQIIDKT